MKKTIQLEIPEGKKAEWVNGVLTLVDEKPQDITERIKTFIDASAWCNENGKEALVDEYNAIIHSSVDSLSDDIRAYLKLRIITAALNEGCEWEPGKQGFGAVVCDDDIRFYYHAETTDMLVGNALIFRTRELAEYAASQFRDIYADFCGCKKGGEE